MRNAQFPLLFSTQIKFIIIVSFNIKYKTRFINGFLIGILKAKSLNKVKMCVMVEYVAALAIESLLERQKPKKLHIESMSNRLLFIYYGFTR